MYKNIAFYRAGNIGDCVVAIRGIYVTKALFPHAHLVVYTNSYGEQLYRQFDFIDEIVNIEYLADTRAHVDARGFDVCILTQASSRFCRIFTNISCKKIFTFLTGSSFIRWNFKTIFFSRNYCKVSQDERIVKLVRELDKKGFERLNMTLVPPPPIVFHAQPKNEIFVENFFNDSHINRQKPNIFINPFVNSTSHNLTTAGYIELVQSIVKTYKDVNVIVITYRDKVDECQEFRKVGAHIFINNDDLLNLVALLKYATILIAPSTGTSHIANNLNTPMIWLTSKIDSFLWRGYNMDPRFFVLLRHPTHKIAPQEEQGYILRVLELLQDFITD